MARERLEGWGGDEGRGARLQSVVSRSIRQGSERPEGAPRADAFTATGTSVSGMIAGTSHPSPQHTCRPPPPAGSLPPPRIDGDPRRVPRPVGPDRPSEGRNGRRLPAALEGADKVFWGRNAERGADPSRRTGTAAFPDRASERQRIRRRMILRAHRSP